MRDSDIGKFGQRATNRYFWTSRRQTQGNTGSNFGRITINGDRKL